MNNHTPWHALKVQPVDSLTFRVQSESGGSPHFVDMMEYGGAGQCDCKHHQCRIAPILTGRKSAPEDFNFVAACKHIMRVWVFLGRKVIERAIEQDTSKTYQGP